MRVNIFTMYIVAGSLWSTVYLEGLHRRLANAPLHPFLLFPQPTGSQALVLPLPMPIFCSGNMLCLQVPSYTLPEVAVESETSPVGHTRSNSSAVPSPPVEQRSPFVYT
ncbi:hypothetical protein B0T14DRAFT_230201 [Immersiella caudata]|uniref:Uncharacterized protein n=1 Tax=Immersiella caudata TaxID=314043 RepID=A0AA39WRP6_9PEZI|nr:hypothetical protein B0T14DRAFT_230201 [Immersiella caudata]